MDSLSFSFELFPPRTPEGLAKLHLAKDPKDHDALLAMVMVNGLQADYAGLIEKRNFASLGYTKQGTNWAQQLLAVDPNAFSREEMVQVCLETVRSYLGLTQGKPARPSAAASSYTGQ